MAAVICPNCNFVNSHGSLFCHKCYTLLLDTIRVDSGLLPNVRSTAPANKRTRLQTQRQTETNKLPSIAISLYLLSVTTPLSSPLVVLLSNSIIIGRSESNDEQTCLDLTSYGAADQGVSRMHLILKRAEKVMVEDMGSSNGTWLNDSLLQPYRPAVIESGSLLRLGKFNIEIYMAE